MEMNVGWKTLCIYNSITLRYNDVEKRYRDRCAKFISHSSVLSQTPFEAKCRRRGRFHRDSEDNEAF
jgi:hypothetical protein